MNETINEKVSVICSYNTENGLVMPRKIRWQGRDYLVNKLNYYHKIRQGKTILHIFHATDGVMDFRLSLDATNLHWTLEEICDGTAN